MESCRSYAPRSAAEGPCGASGREMVMDSVWTWLSGEMVQKSVPKAARGAKGEGDRVRVRLEFSL